MILEVLGKEKSDNEVFASHRTELKIVYENLDFSVSASSTTDLYGIRTIIDGRPGFLTTNSSDPKALREAACEVQTIAKVSPENPANALAESGRASTQSLVDSALLDFSPDEAVRFTELLIAECRKDPRVSIDRAEFGVDLSCRVVVNSKGVERSSAQTSAGWFAMGMARTPDQVTSFDYDGASVSSRSAIEKEMIESIGRFRESVIGSLDPIRGSSYKGKILLHPRAVMDLLAGVILSNCNARSHQDNLSPWKGKVGQQVASEALTVFEDPLDLARPEGWSPFDREGVPTSRHNLIEDGRLNFLGHNCYTAKREGIRPTGNASGGARSIPGIGFSNFCFSFKSGTINIIKEADLLTSEKDVLLLSRFSGNSDPVSGAFSGVAKNSRWIQSDGTQRPVQEVMISGNLFDLITQIVSAGDHMHKLSGGSLTPYVLVDGVSVTAG